MLESIEDYLHSLLSIIAQSPIVRTSNTGLDKRTPRSGLIRGDVILLDGSSLHFRELVDVKAGVSRIMYSYHYQPADGALIFQAAIASALPKVNPTTCHIIFVEFAANHL